MCSCLDAGDMKATVVLCPVKPCSSGIVHSRKVPSLFALYIPAQFRPLYGSCRQDSEYEEQGTAFTPINLTMKVSVNPSRATEHCVSSANVELEPTLQDANRKVAIYVPLSAQALYSSAASGCPQWPECPAEWA